jgi:hypothetical protein
VAVLEHLLAKSRGDCLRLLDGLLRADGEFVEVHGEQASCLLGIGLLFRAIEAHTSLSLCADCLFLAFSDGQASHALQSMNHSATPEIVAGWNTMTC